MKEERRQPTVRDTTERQNGRRLGVPSSCRRRPDLQPVDRRHRSTARGGSKRSRPAGEARLSAGRYRFRPDREPDQRRFRDVDARTSRSRRQFRRMAAQTEQSGWTGRLICRKRVSAKVVVRLVAGRHAAAPSTTAAVRPICPATAGSRRLTTTIGRTQATDKW